MVFNQGSYVPCYFYGSLFHLEKYLSNGTYSHKYTHLSASTHRLLLLLARMWTATSLLSYDNSVIADARRGLVYITYIVRTTEPSVSSYVDTWNWAWAQIRHPPYLFLRMRRGKSRLHTQNSQYLTLLCKGMVHREWFTMNG